MTKETIKRIFDSNIDVGHYFVLRLLNSGETLEELSKIQKIRGWREALIRKQLLVEINGEYIVSERAHNILKFIHPENEPQSEETIEQEKTTFDDFIKSLHANIQSVIYEITKKKTFTNPSGKQLSSSEKELKDRLMVFFKKFGDVDYKLIEKAILRYTKEAVTSKIKYPIRLIYFIWNEKNGSTVSEMMGYIETFQDDVEDKPKSIINTKEHF